MFEGNIPPVAIYYKSCLEPLSIYINFISNGKCFSINISGAPLLNHPLDKYALLFNANVWDVTNFFTPKIIKISSEVKSTLFRLVNELCNNKYVRKKLHNNLKSFTIGQYIFIYPTIYRFDFSGKYINFILAHLDYYETGSSKWIESLSDINNFSKELEDNYEFIGYDSNTNSEVTIGEEVVRKRICRYCGLAFPDVRFSNNSHTISEGLGNKKIFTNTECEICNAHFGSIIENQLIEYFQMYNVFFGIKGKNGEREFQGKNFKFFRVDEKNLVLTHTLSENENGRLFSDNKTSDNLYLKFQTGILPQNLYKAIVKFAIGSLPDEKCSIFSETIDWLCNWHKFPTLPKVCEFKSYYFYNDHPAICVFIRKTDDETLPKGFCLFRYTFFQFVVILPTSVEEALKFSSEENFNRFFNFLPWSSVPGWSFLDWSSDQIEIDGFNLFFYQRESSDHGQSGA